MLSIFWWNIIKRYVVFKGSNAVNYESTLIKLFAILQVTIPFPKFTLFIEKVYFSVTAVWTFDDIYI